LPPPIKMKGIRWSPYPFLISGIVVPKRYACI
jgi:hypothetical protein